MFKLHFARPPKGKMKIQRMAQELVDRMRRMYPGEKFSFIITGSGERCISAVIEGRDETEDFPHVKHRHIESLLGACNELIGVDQQDIDALTDGFDDDLG
jgi:hypothetical protein